MTGRVETRRALPGVALAVWLAAALPAGGIAVGQAPATAEAGGQVAYRLRVELDPAAHHLAVTGELRLPALPDAGPAEFLLNRALEVERAEPPIERVGGSVEDDGAAGFLGLNAGPEPPSGAELARYRILADDDWDGVLRLAWGGRFDFGLSDQKEEYTRGFRETAGVVSAEGIYLAGSGYWVPYLGAELVEFELEARVVGEAAAAGWHLISQGDGTSRDGGGVARWRSGPVDEIYLVGGPLVVHRDAAGAVETLVYLHEEDAGLAGKYLEATAQYLEMYRELLGPYPYGKFALVENFWETGYGMPSFTLLGPTVIRLPFILHSSYPHEILHNWWGNSVFVDYESGNWSEGLTAYLADHLVQEQRGKGAEYRRATLQKYRDYVREGRDFPLVEFRSRHSAATEAVGYGKTLMGFHMLRRRIGDDAFRGALARFYRGHRGRRASFADLRKVFEAEAGEDLGWFFEPWVERAGAPALSVVAEVAAGPDGGFTVRGALRQEQEGEPFAVDVPLALTTAGGVETAVVRAAAAETAFELRSADRPLTLHVDPEFDLFRLLDPRETPPSLGQIFGEPEILAVLPAAEGDRLELYRELLTGWRSDSHAVEIVRDDEIAELPADRAVWLAGRRNRFAELLFADEAGDWQAGAERLVLGEESVAWRDHSAVVVRRHPEDLSKAVGWLVVGPDAAAPGLGRKLPHYGKYSYLAFEGEEPVNVVKGQWSASDSPLVVDLRPPAERGAALAALPADERPPLAETPPVFSLKRLREHVAFLASPELAGRGLGEPGADEAARYVAERFAEAGLVPGGEEGGWFQTVEVADGAGGVKRGVNVVGYVAGSEPAWSVQSVVVGAHYDHLGRGWPDVHAGDEGKIHPGADDNASGVAVLLELARQTAAAGAPRRTTVFVAFTAEEAGRAGSARYVAEPSPGSREGIRAAINLDTVGRLGDGKISVLGTGSADEWQHIFRGAGYVTGVDSRNVPGSAEGSDQWSFLEQGIPAVQIFTGAHDDYHRPTDTADRVDAAGLVKVATFVREAVAYLGGREEPLTVTIAGADAPAAPAAGERAAAPAGGRRVRIGTVPDFAFPGPGVRVESVAEGSPAAAAGLRPGDVLVGLAGREIADLRGYSEALKTLEPGQTVQAEILRDGGRLALEVTVSAR